MSGLYIILSLVFQEASVPTKPLKGKFNNLKIKIADQIAKIADLKIIQFDDLKIEIADFMKKQNFQYFSRNLSRHGVRDGAKNIENFFMVN